MDLDGQQDDWTEFYEAEETPIEDELKLSQSESEPEYVPSKQSQQQYLDDNEESLSFSTPDEGEAEEVKRVIAEKEKIMELFSTCNHPGCGIGVEREDITITKIGAAMNVTATCMRNHIFKWSTSSTVGEGKKQKYLINILLAAYSLLCGLNFGQVVEYFGHLSVECVSRSFFFNLQSQYLQRVIWMTWIFSQKKEIDRVKELNAAGEKTRLAGDGKFDSPGFSAAYCIYSVQSLDTKKIIDFFVAAKHVVKSSGAMEPYAAKTILYSLVFEHGLTIYLFTTDRSSTMKAMMCQFNEDLPENYLKIRHVFDIWHWIKAVLKDLWEASKLVSCEGLSEWIPSIKNQLWWSFQNSIGNATLLKERVLSIPDHLSNVHVFPENQEHRECNHGQLEKKAWLSPDSKAILKVRSALNGFNGTRLADLEMMLEFTHTGDLECYNALLNKYCPKQYFYSHRTMMTRTACAALDHNTNTDREQATTRNGVPKFDLVKQRHGKKYYAKVIKVAKDHSWRDMVVLILIQCLENGTRPTDMMPTLDNESSVRPEIKKPDKSEAIRSHQSRLARKNAE